MKNGLKERFNKEIAPALMKELGVKNHMQVPRLSKVVINMCVKDAIQDSKRLTAAVEDLALIAGQKPCITKAKRSVATFKLREGMNIGAKVTLRKDRMYEFLDRLVHMALPRVRDFRGLSSKSFDGKGNYSLGIREHIVFPEINYDKVEKILGMDITICTTTDNDEEALQLLKAIHIPFTK